jgi:hypothetical protein
MGESCTGMIPMSEQQSQAHQREQIVPKASKRSENPGSKPMVDVGGNNCS